MSSHSVGSNCENDESIGVLDNLKTFLNINIQRPPSVEEPCPILTQLPSPPETHLNIAHDFAAAYVAGALAKKLYKTTNCDSCKMKFEAPSNNVPQNLFIQLKEYKNCKLIKPSSKFTEIFSKLTQKALYILPKIIHLPGIKRNLRQYLINNEEVLSDLFCVEHIDSINQFISILINIVLHHYIKIINNILSGKDSRYCNLDNVTTQAFKTYCKNKRKK